MADNTKGLEMVYESLKANQWCRLKFWPGSPGLTIGKEYYSLLLASVVIWVAVCAVKWQVA